MAAIDDERLMRFTSHVAARTVTRAGMVKSIQAAPDGDRPNPLRISGLVADFVDTYLRLVGRLNDVSRLI